jgi:DNA repair photolyase
MGNDIGAYNTCMHLCRYCYANANQNLVKENIKRHNPDSPFLIGELEKEDIVHEANQKSWINFDNQISFLN